MVKKKKIEWLAVLQGFSMLLVVVGHVMLTNVSDDPTTPVATKIQQVVYSFHMPLFIFISGWLFYYTCIRKGKSYGEVAKAKLKRLGIPFLAFTLMATAVENSIPVVDAQAGNGAGTDRHVSAVQVEPVGGDVVHRGAVGTDGDVSSILLCT